MKDYNVIGCLDSPGILKTKHLKQNNYINNFMKNIITAAVFILLLPIKNFAQQFIDKAVIEYEVKSNIKKTMGNNVWDEAMMKNASTFKTAYYTFTFADNKSIFKFDRWAAETKLPEFMRKSDEENIWYMDHNADKINMQKNVFGTNFNIDDSIPKLQWRITTESRNIAGFNCRKAVAKMFDSVYVFAFYTDEITITGGPCSISGLPGMIMGVTIPRLYTSWVATKVNVNGIDIAAIKPTPAKKYYTNAFVKSTVDERTKDWWEGDESDENKQQKNRFIWTILL
jgi:GLPGLI family protein